jgi:hypothetical protein
MVMCPSTGLRAASNQRQGGHGDEQQSQVFY